ncbi:MULTISPECIES: hypothetical protein [unclassified Sphingomonas]|uniref:hypothetical protein n=1 Tax=unclassified Sphingomonas TaxID=196159 RepID=UPI00226B47D4|nr:MULTISPECIES: hypothetical protein [unclassified Sphingomonas]
MVPGLGWITSYMPVTPAEAGVLIDVCVSLPRKIPAFAGMTTLSAAQRRPHHLAFATPSAYSAADGAA